MDGSAPGGARNSSRAARDRRVADLTVALAVAVDCGDTRQQRHLRQRLIEELVPAAQSLARRYAHRGIPTDDLLQSACVGLAKAAKSFDPRRGHDFGAYAYVTMTGEVKRLFRDFGWDIRPPRRLQELRVRVDGARCELSARLRRSPTVTEIADHLKVSSEAVIECWASNDYYKVLSLDAPVNNADEHDLSTVDTVADPWDAYEHTDNVLSLAAALKTLPPRLRQVLVLRYWHNLNQATIGEHIGVTQMQVSRLLAKAHTELRRHILAENPPREAAGDRSDENVNAEHRRCRTGQPAPSHKARQIA